MDGILGGATGEPRGDHGGGADALPPAGVHQSGQGVGARGEDGEVLRSGELFDGRNRGSTPHGGVAGVDGVDRGRGTELRSGGGTEPRPPNQARR
jgi:hypothetical protein